jgi:hypothetical protein
MGRLLGMFFSISAWGGYFLSSYLRKNSPDLYNSPFKAMLKIEGEVTQATIVDSFTKPETLGGWGVSEPMAQFWYFFLGFLACYMLLKFVMIALFR